MRLRAILLAFLGLMAINGYGQKTAPSLSGGIIRFIAKSGQEKEIQVGKACGDLWVSPDETVIAFISIEKGSPPKPPYDLDNPFIEESAIYVAKRSEDFRPVRVALEPVIIDGRRSLVFRQPSLSPDLKILYFSVPYTMTSWKLMSASLQNGHVKSISDADDYCVIWGGTDSGDLLAVARTNEYDPTLRGYYPGYPYFLMTNSGAKTRLENKEDLPFDQFVDQWSRHRGGACSLSDFGKH